MADVNVSVMADRTPTTVAIVRLRIIGPAEGTDTSSDLKGLRK